jgi:hypothetical protein
LRRYIVKAIANGNVVTLVWDTGYTPKYLVDDAAVKFLVENAGALKASCSDSKAHEVFEKGDTLFSGMDLKKAIMTVAYKVDTTNKRVSQYDTKYVRLEDGSYARDYRKANLYAGRRPKQIA